MNAAQSNLALGPSLREWAKSDLLRRKDVEDSARGNGLPQCFWWRVGAATGPA